MKLALLCVVAVCVACAPDFKDASRMLARGAPPAREPLDERRTSYFDHERQRVRRQWHVSIRNDNSTVLHGTDVQYFPDGKLEYERAYELDRPTGRWRWFWPNGGPRMEAEFGTSEPRPMRWWHENGQLSSEGLARDGLKEGEWTFWHDNGAVQSTGHFRGSLREGPWSFFAADGSLLERAEFRGDVRIQRLQQP